jgi:hypothetical protein
VSPGINKCDVRVEIAFRTTIPEGLDTDGKAGVGYCVVYLDHDSGRAFALSHSPEVGHLIY